MVDSYLLDTSAVFAITDQEEGFLQVEGLLADAEAGKCLLFACSISLMEVYYIAVMEQGEDKAAEIVALVKSWPLKWIYPDERHLLQAGKLKSAHHLSVADALIAAAAKLHGAILVHKDPEMTVLSDELTLLELPFKR